MIVATKCKVTWEFIDTKRDGEEYTVRKLVYDLIQKMSVAEIKEIFDVSKLDPREHSMDTVRSNNYLSELYDIRCMEYAVKTVLPITGTFSKKDQKILLTHYPKLNNDNERKIERP